LEAGGNIHFKELRLEQKLPKRSVGEPIIIPKTQTELDILKQQAERGFSPSALNTYRACPLKFYMRYVAGFKEQDELVEDVDNAMFGTAIHDTLEELYKPYLGVPLTEEILKSMRLKSEKTLAEKFADHVPKESIMQGTNLLAFEVAKAYVDRVLEYDLELVSDGKPNTVLKLEQELVGGLQVELDGAAIPIKLKGTADRIDSTSSGLVRLIDYKTGSADKTLNISKAEQFSSSKADYAFQLMMYHLMYAQGSGSTNTSPNIFFLRLNDIEKAITVSEEKVPLRGDTLVGYTEQLLNGLFEELFDRETPFLQTEDDKPCTYCDFKQLCQR
jgi:ATP-dependent helicase/nuclease subunit B